jgi:hypothetical protein
MSIFHSLKNLTAKASFWQKLNLYLTFFWIVLIPVSFVAGLASQTWFVTLMSLIALVLSSQANWQASRNELKEDIRDPETDTSEVE